MTTYRVKQPLAPGVGGCPDCCWYQNDLACPLDADRLYISMERGSSPLPPGVHTFRCVFNGGGFVSSGGGAVCSTDSYVTTFNNGLGSNYGFYIDIWGALGDGAWSSSVTILIYKNNTGASSTISVRPESDTGNLCLSTGTVTYGTNTTCSPTVLSATITVTDTGDITIS